LPAKCTTQGKVGGQQKLAATWPSTFSSITDFITSSYSTFPKLAANFDPPEFAMVQKAMG
jgi:hypothetical protein